MKKGKIEDQRLQDIVDKILAVSSPEKIVLYGSRARKENGSRSDFDLAIFGRVDMGKVWNNVQNASTLLKIDLLDFDELPEGKFKQKILAEGVVIYERKV